MADKLSQSERLELIEEKTNETYDMVRNMVVFRWIYTVIIILVILGSYVYLGPLVDSILRELRTILGIVSQNG